MSDIVVTKKHAVGRVPDPNRGKVTQEQIEAILEVAISGGTLTDMADAACISVKQLYYCRQSDPLLRSQVAEAQQEGIHHTVDRLVNIQEEFDDPQVMRVVSDNIKWRASKLMPKVYGDRIDLNVTQTLDIKTALDEAKSRAIETEVIRRAIENKDDQE